MIIERPDGSRSVVLAYANPLRNQKGEMVGGVNVMQDISQRKQAEEAQRLLAAVVESSDDAIIVKSLQGRILTWNAGAERLFGYTAQEAVGSPITLIIPPERWDEEKAILERLSRGERVDHFETVRVTKAGRFVDLSLTISPMRNAAGQITSASKIARDISSRKIADEALWR